MPMSRGRCCRCFEGMFRSRGQRLGADHFHRFDRGSSLHADHGAVLRIQTCDRCDGFITADGAAKSGDSCLPDRAGGDPVGNLAKRGRIRGDDSGGCSAAREFYGTEIDAVVRTSRESAAGAIPAEVVARLVNMCMTSRRPPRRRTVGRDAMMGAILRRVLPEKWFDGVLLKMMKSG